MVIILFGKDSFVIRGELFLALLNCMACITSSCEATSSKLLSPSLKVSMLRKLDFACSSNFEMLLTSFSPIGVFWQSRLLVKASENKILKDIFPRGLSIVLKLAIKASMWQEMLPLEI